MRAARAWQDWQGAKFARFGDNMRQVAVTEGDKVATEMKFGFSTNGYGVGYLVAKIDAVTDKAIDALVADYAKRFTLDAALRKGGKQHDALRYGARIELGMRAFLDEGGFKGFTTTFEDLVGLRQLPGLAVQPQHHRIGHDLTIPRATRSRLRALSSVSCHSPSGSESMVMPPPVPRCSHPSSIQNVRIATFRSPRRRSASTQPTAPQ